MSALILLKINTTGTAIVRVLHILYEPYKSQCHVILPDVYILFLFTTSPHMNEFGMAVKK